VAGRWRCSKSGAILLYLAEKTGRCMPADPARRYEAVQWLMFQMGGIGPMFGQLGFFHKFAGKDYEDKRPRDRYVAESKRLLGVLDRHLKPAASGCSATTTASPTSPPSPGSTTWSASTAPASWSVRAFRTQVHRVLQAFLARTGRAARVEHSAA
jgi:GST-like protein